jgi:hypothetical protein
MTAGSANPSQNWRRCGVSITHNFSANVGAGERELRHQQDADLAQGSSWESKLHTFASELTNASSDEVLDAVRCRLRLAQKSKAAAPARTPMTMATTMATMTPAARPRELFAIFVSDGDVSYLAAALPPEPVLALGPALLALAPLPGTPAASAAGKDLDFGASEDYKDVR